MDVNGFGPFLPTTWGTVSDWGIFFVSTIGTWYIVQTFRQQKRINEEQLSLNREQKELNRLALEKDKREVFGAFTFVDKSEKMVPEDGLIVEICAVYNKLLSIEVFPILNEEPQQPIWGILYVCSPTSKHHLKLKLLPNESPIFKAQYLIYYTDQSGRPYIQRLGVQNNTPVIIYPLPQESEFRNQLPKNKWSH